MVREEGLEPPDSVKRTELQSATLPVTCYSRMVHPVGLEPTRPFGQRGLSPPRLPSSAKDAKCVHPKGLEPSRPFGHRSLNPARLPKFRQGCSCFVCAAGTIGDGHRPYRYGPRAVGNGGHTGVPAAQTVCRVNAARKQHVVISPFGRVDSTGHGSATVSFVRH